MLTNINHDACPSRSVAPPLQIHPPPWRCTPRSRWRGAAGQNYLLWHSSSSYDFILHCKNIVMTHFHPEFFTDTITSSQNMISRFQPAPLPCPNHYCKIPHTPVAPSHDGGRPSLVSLLRASIPIYSTSHPPRSSCSESRETQTTMAEGGKGELGVSRCTVGTVPLQSRSDTISKILQSPCNYDRRRPVLRAPINSVVIFCMVSLRVIKIAELRLSSVSFTCTTFPKFPYILSAVQV